eukprot:6479288-Amphidinium_carterae.4
MCAKCQWQVVWYEVEKSIRPLVELLPGTITVQPLRGVYEEHLLKPPRKSRTRRAAMDFADDSASFTKDVLPSGEEVENSESGEDEYDEMDDGAEDPDDESLGYGLGELLARAETMGELEPKQREETITTPEPQNLAEDLGFKADLIEAALPMSPQSSQTHGAASSSHAIDEHGVHLDPPPVPPPAGKRVRLGTVRVAIGMAEAEVRLKNGRLAYHSSKQSFEASCKVHTHCVLTRSRHGRTVKGCDGKQGGRPIGFLGNWLLKADDFSTAAEHKNKANMAMYTHAERVAARQMVAESPQGQVLLAQEKAKPNPEDDDEPVDLAGLL